MVERMETTEFNRKKSGSLVCILIVSLGAAESVTAQDNPVIPLSRRSKRGGLEPVDPASRRCPCYRRNGRQV